MSKFIKSFFLTVLSIALFACSNSNRSKNIPSNADIKTPANFTDLTYEQQQGLGYSSALVIIEAIDMANANNWVGSTPFTASNKPDVFPFISTNKKILKRIKQHEQLNSRKTTTQFALPLTTKESNIMSCDLGGSFTVSNNIDDKTGNETTRIIYNNCKEDLSDGDWNLTNGVVTNTIEVDDDQTTMKLGFNNFEVIDFYGGKIERMIISGHYIITTSDYNDEFDEASNASIEWSLMGSSNEVPISTLGKMICLHSKCTLSSDIKMSDGKTYHVENLSMAYQRGEVNFTNGKIYHPDYGHFLFDAEIDYFCGEDAESPLIGTITYKDIENNMLKYTSTNCRNEPSIIAE